MSFKRFEHIQIAMPRGMEEKAREFYVSALGMVEQPKPESLRGKGGCWFISNGVKIHLGIDDPFSPSKKGHPAVVVEDLEVYKERLTSLKYQICDDVPIDGYTRIFVNDPFGNRIELMQETDHAE